jgi:hypothetical protein
MPKVNILNQGDWLRYDVARLPQLAAKPLVFTKKDLKYTKRQGDTPHQIAANLHECASSWPSQNYNPAALLGAQFVTYEGTVEIITKVKRVRDFKGTSEGFDDDVIVTNAGTEFVLGDMDRLQTSAWRMFAPKDLQVVLVDKQVDVENKARKHLIDRIADLQYGQPVKHRNVLAKRKRNM